MHSSATIALLVVLLSAIFANSLPINETLVPVSWPAKVEKVHERSCFADTDCNNHGRCSASTGVCQCDQGWTTIVKASGVGEACAYQQRSKQTAFFLSLFLGLLGVDWFYLSRASLIYIGVGILKLLVGFGCGGNWSALRLGPDTENFESMKTRLRGGSICFSLLAFAWWVVDWARILGNRFPDGNLVPLTSW